MLEKIRYGIIGGSLFNEKFIRERRPEGIKFIGHIPSKKLRTSFFGCQMKNNPSSDVMVVEIGEIPVAIILRHGRFHQIPPDLVPIEANCHALMSLGVDRIVSISSCGTLSEKFQQGDIVLADAFINRTNRPWPNLLEGELIAYHRAIGEPCVSLQKIARDSLFQFEFGKRAFACKDVPVRVVVVSGPSFSDRFECQRFVSQDGADLISMTQREYNIFGMLNLHAVSIMQVTDDNSAGEGEEVLTGSYVAKQAERFNSSTFRYLKAFLENCENDATVEGCGCVVPFYSACQTNLKHIPYTSLDKLRLSAGNKTDACLQQIEEVRVVPSEHILNWRSLLV